VTDFLVITVSPAAIPPYPADTLNRVTQSPVVPVEPAPSLPAVHDEGAIAPVLRLRTVAPRTRSRVASFVALTKPRIIELLLVTTLPAMILAAGGLPTWSTVLATMFGGTLAAGSANALNCYVDRDIDALMRRTTHRPLARHDVSPRAALVFGLTLGVFAVALMGAVTNWLAAGLTAAAIAFYVVVYTMLLKRRTAQNIVWGGAAGCMPVLIGWAAVTGSLAWPAAVLFAVVFFWTPPHFWALAIRYRDDYARANVPMLPVVASPMRVAVEIVVYAWLTVLTSLLLWPVATGWVYGVLAGLAGLGFLLAAHRLLARTRTGGNAKAAIQLFHFSNSYLAFVFVAVAVDTFVR
jgi:heme o synthase